MIIESRNKEGKLEGWIDMEKEGRQVTVTHDYNPRVPSLCGGLSYCWNCEGVLQALEEYIEHTPIKKSIFRNTEEVVLRPEGPYAELMRDCSTRYKNIESKLKKKFGATLTIWSLMNWN